MWQPKASIETLKQRAEILKKIRTFFEARHVLEVDVPLIGEYSVTDPYLDALSIEREGKAHFLQTSPEYFMKRLLAVGCESIYYLGKAFRADELGRTHMPEFTMLEWYRSGFDDQQLMNEVIDLLNFLKPGLTVYKVSYEDIFFRYTRLNPHSASSAVLKEFAHSQLDISWEDDDKSGWLDLIFTHCVEPNLHEGLYAIYHYPACQCALAKTQCDDSGVNVAKRFELYFNGVELANGYWELTDAREQRRRFEDDNQKRRALGKPTREIDPAFMNAIESGLPECAGVALGVDRLVMALLSLSSIDQQSSF